MEGAKEEMEKNPGIVNVNILTDIPGGITWITTANYWNGKEMKSANIPFLLTNKDFNKTFKTEIIAGTDFSEQADSVVGEYLINETAAKQFGLAYVYFVQN